MTIREALKLLQDAPKSENTPSRVNTNLTQFQAVKIMYTGLFSLLLRNGKNFEATIPDLYEKRVYQVVKNQIRRIEIEKKR